MLRKIIRIDKEKCNGCGLCAAACHEGAIEMVNGKAELVRENFCDGLGDCLPACPTGAIAFETREAPAYDEAAVNASRRADASTENCRRTHGGCPGSQTAVFSPVFATSSETSASSARPVSELRQWPVQIKLVPVQAPFFEGAQLLIAADCAAYAYAAMHEDFIKGKVTLIGCPKLDSIDYSEKLTQIIALNGIKSVTVVRMEVPCCGGLQVMTETALKNSGRFIPLQVVTITRDGRIAE